MTKTNAKENSAIYKVPDIAYLAIGTSYLYMIRKTCNVYQAFAAFIGANILTLPVISHNILDLDNKTERKIEAAAGITVAILTPPMLDILQIPLPVTFAAVIGYSFISEDNREYYSTNLRKGIEDVITDIDFPQTMATIVAANSIRTIRLNDSPLFPALTAVSIITLYSISSKSLALSTTELKIEAIAVSLILAFSPTTILPVTIAAYIGYSVVFNDIKASLRESMRYVIECIEQEQIRKIDEAREHSARAFEVTKEAIDILSNFTEYLSGLFSNNLNSAVKLVDATVESTTANQEILTPETTIHEEAVVAGEAVEHID